MDISRNKFSNIVCVIFSAILLLLFFLSIETGFGITNKVSSAIIAGVLCAVIVGLAFILNKLFKKITQGKSINENLFFTVGIIVSSLIFVAVRLLIISDIISVPMQLGNVYENAKIAASGSVYVDLKDIDAVMSTILSLFLKLLGNTYFPIIIVQFIIAVLAYVFLLFGIKNLIGKFAAFLACFGYAAVPVFFNSIATDTADNLILMIFTFSIFLSSLYVNRVENKGANAFISILYGILLGIFGLYTHLYLCILVMPLIVLCECASEETVKKVVNSLMLILGSVIGFALPLLLGNFLISGKGVMGFADDLMAVFNARTNINIDTGLLASIVSQKWIFVLMIICVFYCFLFWRNRDDAAHIITAFFILFTVQLALTSGDGREAYSYIYMISLLAIAGYGLYDLGYEDDYVKVSRIEDDMAPAVVMSIGSKVINTEEQANNIINEQVKGGFFSDAMAKNEDLEYDTSGTDDENNEDYLSVLADNIDNKTDKDAPLSDGSDSEDNIPFYARQNIKEEVEENKEEKESGLKSEEESVFSYDSVESYNDLSNGENEKEKPASNTNIFGEVIEEKPADEARENIKESKEETSSFKSGVAGDNASTSGWRANSFFDWVSKPETGEEAADEDDHTQETQVGEGEGTAEDKKAVDTSKTAEVINPETEKTTTVEKENETDKSTVEKESKYSMPEERKTSDFGMNDVDFESLFNGTSIPPKFVRDDMYDSFGEDENIEDVTPEEDAVEETAEEPVEEVTEDNTDETDSKDKKAYVDTFFSYLYDESVFDQPIEMPEHKEKPEEKYVSNASKFADLELDLGFDAFDYVPEGGEETNTGSRENANAEGSEIANAENIGETAAGIAGVTLVAQNPVSTADTTETEKLAETVEKLAANDEFLFADTKQEVNSDSLFEESNFETEDTFAFEENKAETDDIFKFEESKPETEDTFKFEESKSEAEESFSFEESKPETEDGFTFEESKTVQNEEFTFDETPVNENDTFTFDENENVSKEEFSFDDAENVSNDSFKFDESEKDTSFDKPEPEKAVEPAKIENGAETAINEPKPDDSLDEGYGFDDSGNFRFEEMKDEEAFEEKPKEDPIDYEDEFDFDDLKFIRNSEPAWDNVSHDDFTIKADNKSDEALENEIYKALADFDKDDTEEISIEEQLQKKIDNDDNFSFEESLNKRLDAEEEALNDEFSYEKAFEKKLDAEEAIEKATQATNFPYEERLSEKIALEESINNSHELGNASVEDAINQKVETEDSIPDLSAGDDFSFQEAFEQKLDAEQSIEKAKIKTMLDEFGPDEAFNDLLFDEEAKLIEEAKVFDNTTDEKSIEAETSTAEPDTAADKTEVVKETDKIETEADKTENVSEGPKEEKTVEYIENPLPLPKKHVHRELDYGRSIPDVWMHYDIDVGKDNNFFDV
ncbi:MAG: glycosyltransferase family 39 protein [Lachnospiraceae bacterium]|nr:glycosyltransferase family 39 protein [Lachnospiraceae bacterium]